MRSEEEVREEVETMKRVANLLYAHGEKEAAELLNGAIFWLEWVLDED